GDQPRALAELDRQWWGERGRPALLVSGRAFARDSGAAPSRSLVRRPLERRWHRTAPEVGEGTTDPRLLAAPADLAWAPGVAGTERFGGEVRDVRTILSEALCACGDGARRSPTRSRSFAIRRRHAPDWSWCNRVEPRRGPRSPGGDEPADQ